MNRLLLIISFIFVFIVVTAMALSFDNPNYGRRVKFTNVSFAIRNSGNEVVNVTKDITSPSTVKLVENQTVSSDVNTKTDVDSYFSQNNKYATKSETLKIMYKNLDDTKYDEALKNSSKIKYERKEYGDTVPKYKTVKDAINAPSANDDEYVYDNVDWSRWKSNFVNRILDDSVYISELDSYPNGAFFYYSFNVDSYGSISNINVRSVYLSDEDKQLVKNLIKSYAHKPITKFPPKSKRRSAKVSAIMMLSNSETNYSKPSDFNDTERVKYKR